MGKFIHQNQLRAAFEDRVHIQFGQGDIVIFDLLARQNFQPCDEFFGLGALVGFDIANDHIHALFLALVRGFEHGIGFAHTRDIAEEDFEFSPVGFFGLNLFQ